MAKFFTSKEVIIASYCQGKSVSLICVLCCQINICKADATLKKGDVFILQFKRKIIKLLPVAIPEVEEQKLDTAEGLGKLTVISERRTSTEKE